MKMKTIAACMLLVGTSTAAMSQDVLMRRPLPNLTGTGGTPVTTPTPTPGSDPDGGTPTPIEGGTYDPDTPPPVPDPGPPDGYAFYEWNPGPWEGSATCGEQSHITRSIGCTRYTQGFGGGPVISSYSPKSPGKGVLASAIYDPSTSKAKLSKAQFGGDVPLNAEDVPVSYCVAVQDQIGAPPINDYAGTKAGCQYDPVKVDDGEWTLPPYSDGTATCSAQAYRQPTYACQDQDGRRVAIDYCLENLREGGRRDYSLVNPEYGNYSGCTARWYGVGSDLNCHAAGDTSNTYAESGAVHTADYTYSCVRSDGTTLYGVDEVACTGERPADGVRSVGSCTKRFYASAQYGCYADNESVVVRKLLTGSQIYDFDNVVGSMCRSTGATCCSMRQVYNSNYADAPYGAYEGIGTMGTPVRMSFYFDDHDKAIRKDEEGPMFYVRGGGPGRWTADSYGAPDDDTGQGAPPGGGGDGGDADN